MIGNEHELADMAVRAPTAMSDTHDEIGIADES